MSPFRCSTVGVFVGVLVSGFTGFAFSPVARALVLHDLEPIEPCP